jgi:hypothetical protein
MEGMTGRQARQGNIIVRQDRNFFQRPGVSAAYINNKNKLPSIPIG